MAEFTDTCLRVWKNGKNEPRCCISNRLSGSNEGVRENREEDNIIRGEMLKIC